ncbi:MAG: two-component sensor histidine kinase, partial [Croceitalea sp.]|nr:two-component sensor histidine kinase [Croceitalea sp.]
GIAVFIIVNQRVLNQKLRFGQKQQESNQEIYNLMLSQYGKMEEGKKLEQKRVSEELHDGILGQMLGIRLVLSGLNERNDEASMQQRAELIEKLRDLEEEIRTISHELNQSAYEKVHNFIIAIEELVKTIDVTSDINVNFIYDKNINWDHLQGDLKINSYRIIQECIQNSIKHAQCKNINIRFEYHNKLLNLSVADDGVGFDTTKGKRGIGIKNIVSRVKKLNGTLEINSIINKGTTITVAIPIIFDSINDPNSKVSRKIVQEA